MTQRTLAAVLFTDFEMLDLYGPLEMFSYFPDAFDIRTVARQPGPIKASGGPHTVAQYGMDDDTMYDLVLVPGGRGARSACHDEGLLKWLAMQAQRADFVTSVCTGSLLLARAGVLDGRHATTNKLAFDRVAEQSPGVHWQRRARWVRDGNIYTSSGVSAGMDMALAVIEECLGPDAARDAALWAEYTRNADPDNDPFTDMERAT